MKRLIVIAGTLMLSLTLANCKSTPKPDSKKVANFLGDQIVRIVGKPDRVLSYKLKPGAGVLKVSGYDVEKPGPQLNKDQVKKLQELIFKEKSYNFETTKRCAFLPSTAYRFEKEGKSLDVLICYSCNEWVFKLDEGEQREDFDGAIEDLKKLDTEVFQ